MEDLDSAMKQLRYFKGASVPVVDNIDNMRFIGVITIADVWNELSWNDWIPADAETWQTLRDITPDLHSP